MPRRQTTGNSHDWTKAKIISHLQLSEEEYDECRKFLNGFLAESGLLGKNFKGASNQILYSLMETLRTKDHNEIPSAILNRSASYDGMHGLVGFSMKVNNLHLQKERYRRLGRERGRRSGREDPQPSMPLSLAEASPPRWTKSRFTSRFQLSEEEYKGCRNFLEHFLTESGQLGKRNSGQLIQYSLMETLRTKAHNEVPSAILKCSTSCDDMHWLVGFSIQVNSEYVTKGRKQGRGQQSRQSSPILHMHAEPSSNTEAQWQIQAPHQDEALPGWEKPKLENCTLFVCNSAHPGRDALSPVTQVLKDGASQPLTHQDLDFCRWKDILCEECNFDESFNSIGCSVVGRPYPCYVAVRNEPAWQAAILDMTNAGLTQCAFWME
ncbi:hypothetical protein V8E54_008245 [Elaphomyces granulatus]